MEEKSKQIIRIALIGPESTAKSTLSEHLAKHYNTVWVKEYSREYLQSVDNYTLADVLVIAQRQLETENELLKKANQCIFADTELIISKVWCLDVFKTCPQWIENNILPNKYDLYLLTFPDLEWEKDPLRENPYRREFFFNWYEKELKQIDATYTIIKGKNIERLNNAINAIENFIAGTRK
ncbi:MAG: putative ATPase/kinase involved in metabolism [Bacteroidota bacterium]|jgi:NadR type nicotinamide-nucleotide adenylyltransferase|nr:putative ATPase/kinase involved in metabolism [Bacteroidota bacterium]